MIQQAIPSTLVTIPMSSGRRIYDPEQARIYFVSEHLLASGAATMESSITVHHSQLKRAATSTSC